MKSQTRVYLNFFLLLKSAAPVVLCLFFAGYSTAEHFLPASADNPEKLIVYAGSQEELDTKIRSNTAATTVHLILASEMEFNLSVVGSLKKAEILTVEFPVYTEIGIMGDGGAFNRPLDLLFLKQLQELRYLVIDWSGMVQNGEAIGQLPQLAYARIPYDAFSEALFHSPSIQQLDITDLGTFSVTAATQPLELTPYGYENQFGKNNKSFQKFDKIIRQKSTVRSDWPNEIVQLTSTGDTILSITGIKSGTFNWVMKDSKTGEIFKGHSTKQNPAYTERSVFNPVFKRVVQLTGDRKRITWSDYYQGPDRLTYREENYTSNGLKDGLFLQKTNDYILLEEHYKNGKMVYQFPYNGEQPVLPVHNYLEHFSAAPKEAFFEEGKLVTLRTRGYEQTDRPLLITIPVNELKIDGLLYVLSPSSDTLLSIEYRKDNMHGRYYYYSESVSDTVSVYARYLDGKLSGNRKIVRTHTTTTSDYNEGFLTKSITHLNRNKQPLEQIAWNPERKIYVEKMWTVGGKLANERTLDANMKVLTEKKIIEIQEQSSKP